MEQIVQDRVQLRPESHTLPPKYRLLPYLRVIVGMLIGFAAVSLSARTLGQHTARPPDLLAAFADMRPGQPRVDLEAGGFTCYDESYNYYPIKEHCGVYFETGIFTHIELLIMSDGKIRSAAFTVRGNALRLGDLMLVLGNPEVHRNGRQAVFVWRSSGSTASAISNTGLFSPFVSLKSVSFTDPRLIGCDCE
jgi:hypothetical protein